jgi:hypothetical protein
METNDDGDEYRLVNKRRPSSPNLNSRDPRKLLRLSTTNPNVSTANRFDVLSQNDNDISEINQETVKAIKPPPIHIKNVTNYQNLISSLKSIAGDDEFTCKSTVDMVTVYPSTSDLYRKLVTILKAEKLQFHTYQLPQDRPHRVVLRGIHHTTPTDTIKEELIQLGFSIRSVTNVISRNKLPLPLFFIDIEPKSEAVGKIYKLDRLLHTVVTVEELRRHKTIVQCTRCQKFNHTKSYCNHEPKCVKCAGTHFSSECTKDKQTPPKCTLCDQAHTANYRGCQVFQDLQKRRRGSQTHHTVKGTSENVPTHAVPLPQTNDPAIFPTLPQATWTNGQINMQPTNLQSAMNFNSQSNTNNHHHSYSSKVRGDHYSTNNVNSTTNLSELMSNFLIDIKNLIMPMMSMLAQLTQVLLTKHAP